MSDIELPAEIDGRNVWKQLRHVSCVNTRARLYPLHSAFQHAASAATPRMEWSCYYGMRPTILLRILPVGLSVLRLDKKMFIIEMQQSKVDKIQFKFKQ